MTAGTYSASQSDATSIRRVLVIEDDPEFRSRLEDDFQRRGLNLSVAGTFVDAKEAMRNASAYSAIVIDIVLPDGNGMDLVDLLRHSPDCPPIIIISEYLPDYLSQMMSFHPEVNLIVAKPIEAPYLAAIVDQVARTRN